MMVNIPQPTFLTTTGGDAQLAAALSEFVARQTGRTVAQPPQSLAERAASRLNHAAGKRRVESRR